MLSPPLLFHRILRESKELWPLGILWEFTRVTWNFLWEKGMSELLIFARPCARSSISILHIFMSLQQSPLGPWGLSPHCI